MVEETKKLTDKQEAFLEALCGEAKGNIRGAMNIAGYSENTKVSEIVSSLKDEIVERSSCASAYSIEKSGVSSERSKVTLERLYPPETIFIFSL